MDAATKDLNVSGEGTLSVVVVGAGPGGLAAGYRLRKAGADVTVLDEGNEVGGKIRTRHIDGFHIELGPNIVGPGHVRMLELAMELGLQEKVESMRGSIIGIAQRSGIQYIDASRMGRDVLFSSLLSWRSKLSLFRFVLDVRGARKHLSDHELSSSADLDTESAAEYAYRRLDPRLFDDLLDLRLRLGVGTPGKFLSKVDLFKMYDETFKYRGESRSFPLGLEQYAKALASHLTVRLQSTVNEVVESTSGVTVTFTDYAGETNTIRADACIVATDAPATAKLLPQLPPESRAFLNSVRYTTMTNLHAALKTPPDIPAFVVLVPDSVNPDILAITLEHNRAPKSVPAGRGFITVYPNPDKSRELCDLDDAEVTRRLVQMTEPILPSIEGNIDFSFINRWPRVVPSNRPGDYKRLRDFKANLPDWKRIRLAGDFLSLANMNFATLRGERAAEQLLQLKLSSST